MNYVIRPLTAADEPVLWEMVRQALRTTEGEPAPSSEVVQRPEFARYVEDWGREGDTGFVAYDPAQNELLGAVWCRVPGNKQTKQEGTPELAFVVKPLHRKHGIGAAMLTQFVKANPKHSTIAIRASANNPAVRLYERFGFRVVESGEGSVVMHREF